MKYRLGNDLAGIQHVVKRKTGGRNTERATKNDKYRWKIEECAGRAAKVYRGKNQEKRTWNSNQSRQVERCPVCRWRYNGSRRALIIGISRHGASLDATGASIWARKSASVAIRLDDFRHRHTELVFHDNDFSAGDQSVIDIDVNRFTDLAV